jgi:hypothetical protein
MMIDLEKLEKEQTESLWQRHRMTCLKLAAKFGATTPEQAFEMADKISSYILRGRVNVKKVIDFGTNV